MSKESLWAALGRCQTDLDFRCQLTGDLDEAVQKNGLQLDGDEKQALRHLMNAPLPPAGGAPFGPDPQFIQAMNRQREAQLKRNNELADFTLHTLKDTLHNAKNAYRIITLMNRVMFFTGIGLFLFAAFYGAFSNDKAFSLVLGGLGVANFVALFILGPIEKTQIALSNLVQVEIAFMHYFEQMLMWEFYAQMPKGNPPMPDPANIERATAALREVASETMESLQHYVEDTQTNRRRSLRRSRPSSEGSPPAAGGSNERALRGQPRAFDP